MLWRLRSRIGPSLCAAREQLDSLRSRVLKVVSVVVVVVAIQDTLSVGRGLGSSIGSLQVGGRCEAEPRQE